MIHTHLEGWSLHPAVSHWAPPLGFAAGKASASPRLTGLGLCEFRNLGQIAYVEAAAPYHAAADRIFQARNNLKESGLARTVDANQTYLLPLLIQSPAPPDNGLNP